MKPEDLYHAGIVVDDFDGTLRWLTEAAGYRWCDPYEGEQLVVTPDGDQVIPMRITYSIDEPRLEILQSAPGTIWTPAESGIHHLGYWSADVDADVARLEGLGMTLEARAPMGDDGTSLWAYCNAPGRPRIEVVSTVMREAMSGWLTTGSFS